jgi:predicted 2-oxoglutarate/Fe(II)-dependent dioxygenase YbiX
MSYLHIPKFFDTKQIYEELKASQEWFVHQVHESVADEGEPPKILELPHMCAIHETLQTIMGPKETNLFDLLNAVFDAKHESLEEKTNPSFPVSRFSFKRYQPGFGIGPHVDVSSNGFKTFTTILLYFNDNYEGGEFAMEEKVIKPEAGDLIAITYNHLHEARPPSRGEKYIAVGQIPAEFKTFTVAEDTVGKI